MGPPTKELQRTGDLLILGVGTYEGALEAGTVLQGHLVQPLSPICLLSHSDSGVLPPLPQG